MIQQLTSLLSALRLTDMLQRNKKPISWGLSATAMLWLVVLQAAPNYPGLLSVVREAGPQPAAATNFAAPSDTTIAATICANEFYVFYGDSLNQSGQYTAGFVLPNGLDSVVILDLVVLPLGESTVEATICAGEIYPFNGQLLSQLGTYQAVLTGANGCDSIVRLELSVLPSPVTTLNAGICAGSSYLFNGDTLTESGIYTVVLPAESGCDSTITLTLDVVPFFDVKINASICTGETYIFGNDTLSVSGVYVDSLTAAGGCDSTVTLTLKVLPSAATHLEVGVCTGFSYIFQGDTLTQSGIYIEQLAAANGCDSLVILDFTVADFFDINRDVTICAGETYVFGGDSLDIGGVYIDSLTAAGGCDSTVTLTLTVLPVQTNAFDLTICQGDTLDYNDILLTVGGVYDIVLTGENGCDSTVTITLTVLPRSTTALSATICQQEIYDFNGVLLDESGVYTNVLSAANACDSIVTLTLTVLPVPKTEITANLCPGEAYLYEGDTLNSTGSYPYTFTAANGCDSIVTIVVNELPSQSTTLAASICTGESYVFDGDTLTATGNYSALLTGVNGCDSTVALVLTVLPVQIVAVSASTCAGADYVFNGDTLTQSGVYTAVLSSANGCDSTVTLTLTVLPIATTALSATTCSNQPYLYNGQALTNSANYAFTFVGANGCDSIVTLNLTVLPVAETALSATICAGQGYDYNGDTLTMSGAYNFTYIAINGCDSIVSLQLTVLPLLSSMRTLAVCAGSSYIFAGDTLTVSGTYLAIQPGSNGCDSTATLVLSFVENFATTLQATICAGSSYDFDGQVLTDAGEYVQTITTTGGCDSIVTLTLTVLPTLESITTATICAGASYTFNGQSFTQGGTYLISLVTPNGCDSIAILNLTVLPTSTTTVAATICSNETYPFNGTLLTAAGTYNATLTGVNGCDSLIVLNLAVLPALSSSFQATVCANEPYVYNGDILTNAGTFTYVLSAENGCDSTVTLELSVLPLAESAFAAVLCGGGPYNYNGQTLTTSGTYPFVFPNASGNGCDSMVTVFLTIFPAIPITQISATICSGTAYNFYGTPLSIAGTYTADLASATGCDSTVVLTLAVQPVVTTAFNATICAGDSYPFNGNPVTLPGVYIAQLQSAAGCDSTVTLTLMVTTLNATVTLQNATLTALAANATYQWIDCNGNTPIPGATGSSYTATVTGQYAVIVTQGACSVTSVCQLVQIVGTNEPLASSSWSIQPNPARTQATVLFTEVFSGQVWIEIYDPAGRLLQRQQAASGAKQVDLDLAGFPDGLLLVRLQSEAGTSTKRLIKAEE